MSDRDELTALRRLSELEAKAGVKPSPQDQSWMQKAQSGVTQLASDAGDYIGEMVGNLPSSGAQAVSDQVNPFIHPVDTLKNVGTLVTGVLNKLGPDVNTSGIRLPFDQQAENVANATGEFFKDRYGGFENIKNTIKTDPVGAAADLASVFYGGGGLLSKLPGTAGKSGNFLQKAGAAVDPVNAVVKTVKGGGALGEALLSNTLGFTSGLGPTSIREGARAGGGSIRPSGVAQAESYLNQMRGNAPVTDVVDSARAALETMRKERSAEYTKNMDVIKTDKTQLKFDTIDKAISEVKSSGIYNGKIIDKSAANTWQKIDEIIQDWKISDPKKFHTPEGMDALKKAIGDVRDSSEFGTPARRVADKAYHAVKNQIVKQAPEYAKTMRDYESASAMLKEMEKTLSINPKANIDTTLRKLQSVLRNNANTNYGQRAKLAEVLVEKGADTLMPQLAGQAASSVTPRSLQGIGSALTAGSAAITNPWLIPAIAASSPRLVGEGAYYAGKAGTKAAALAKSLAKMSGMDNPATRLGIYQSGRIDENSKIHSRALAEQLRSKERIQ